jgi:hypothetical protein
MKKEKIVASFGVAAPPHISLDGAAPRESRTRADFRRKYLIPRLSALIRALFKKN